MLALTHFLAPCAEISLTKAHCLQIAADNEIGRFWSESVQFRHLRPVPTVLESKSDLGTATLKLDRQLRGGAMYNT